MSDPEGSSGLPARRLSSQQLEAVIRRAVELQTSAGGDAEGVSEAEVLRIGSELGLPAAHVRQALAEVRSRGEPEQGGLAALIGPGDVSVARTVALPAERAAADLERYFTQCEYMIVQRRRPGWTVYERGGGIAAAIGRATRSAPRLNRGTVEVSVNAAEEGGSFVSLRVPLRGERWGFTAGTVLGGGGAGAAVATAAGIAIAPPAALLGLPVLAATWWAMRAGHHGLASRLHTRLESVIDRLESGELLPPRSGWKSMIRALDR